MNSLSGIVVFVKTAETLSFVAAGRALGLTASAVGKSIAKLEENLGVRLFQRTTRTVRLTAAGELFFERCQRIMEDLKDAETMLSHVAQAPRGRLRVSLPTIGYRFLLPVLPEFRRLHPEVELDLDFNDALVDIVNEGVDIAIRSGSLPESRLISRRLGTFRFVLCGSPGYLKRKGVPRVPSDLKQHDCIRFRFLTTGKLQNWTLSGDPAWSQLRLTASMTCNNMEAVLAAAIDGHGIAYMPDFLARDSIKAGAVQPVLERYLQDHGQFWALWASSRQLSPKVRVFVDFISERLFRVNRE
ncbi:LysR substrate-binding domain-containing protein [Pendulispora brunnea]|uniref:LysR substrate-binding domain-containing protein n=1 Tax=Pendulispora brunnea TaxID=2905690 RepID=A0ABZ2KAM7_9BACT